MKRSLNLDKNNKTQCCLDLDLNIINWATESYIPVSMEVYKEDLSMVI